MKKERFVLIVLAFLLCLFPHSLKAQIQFMNVAEQAGVGGDLNSPLSTGMTWGDYDNDGWLDLFVTNWGTAVGEAADILYHNNTDGTFSSVAEQAGLFSYDNGISAAWGDYDNDGFLDLYIVNYWEQDALYRNNGDGSFDDATGYAGVDLNPLGNSSYAAWGDYDNDGDIDLYLCKFYFANELYANNGDGSFSEIGYSAGVDDIRDSWNATWTDYDNDGNVDLYVVNREQDNAIYRNDGNGTFTNVSGHVPIKDTELGKSAAWGDYNNDGLIDLFLANIGANKLYENSGSGSFVEKGVAVGVRFTGDGWENWDAAWGDYDGDGDLDLFVAGGAESDDASVGMFLNIGGTFINVTSNSGDISPGPHRATACSFADYDNDGDLDIFMTSYRDAQNILRNTLYQNQKNNNTFLKILVRGKGAGFSNSFGIGAKIRIFDKSSGTLKGMREIQSGSGPLEAVFGLVSGQTYRVEASFPGAQQTVVSQDVVVPETLTIQEP